MKRIGCAALCPYRTQRGRQRGAVPRGSMDSRLRGNDWHGAGVPLKCHCGSTKWLTQLLRQTRLGRAHRCGTRTRISLLACLAAWLLGCLAAWLLGCQSVTQSGLALAHNMQAKPYAPSAISPFWAQPLRPLLRAPAFQARSAKPTPAGSCPRSKGAERLARRAFSQYFKGGQGFAF